MIKPWKPWTMKRSMKVKGNMDPGLDIFRLGILEGQVIIIGFRKHHMKCQTDR